MPEVRETVEIAASPETVWDLCMDPDRLGEWVTAHSRAENAPENLEAGDSFDQVLCLGGQPVDVRWTLERCERPSFAEWDADGPRDSGAKVRYLLESANGGTRFRYENDFELPGGAVRLIAGRLSGAPARRAARKSLKKLKALAESESA